MIIKRSFTFETISVIIPFVFSNFDLTIIINNNNDNNDDSNRKRYGRKYSSFFFQNDIKLRYPRVKACCSRLKAFLVIWTEARS